MIAGQVRVALSFEASVATIQKPMWSPFLAPVTLKPPPLTAATTVLHLNATPLLCLHVVAAACATRDTQGCFQ